MSDQKQLFLVVIKNGWHIRGLCRHLRVVHVSFLWKHHIARFFLMKWLTGNDVQSGDKTIWPMSSLTWQNHLTNVVAHIRNLTNLINTVVWFYFVNSWSEFFKTLNKKRKKKLLNILRIICHTYYHVTIRK